MKHVLRCGAIALSLLATSSWNAGCSSDSGSVQDSPDVATDQAAEDTLTPDAQEIRGETEPDTAAGEDLPVFEVDDTPGCGPEFCAAGPDSAPDPSTWGPFPVGVTTMMVDSVDHQGKPRKLRVEVWYPTTDEFKDGPFETIDIYEDAPEEMKEYLVKFKDLVPPIETRSVRDAPARHGDAPYPMVLFSHGAYGVRYQSVFFTIYLASHGYVVAAPDHTKNTLYDILGPEGYNMDDVILSALDRPYDAVVTLTSVLSRSKDPEDFLYGMMNEKKVGMSGHSFGGFLSLLMAVLDARIKVAVPMAPATGWLGAVGYPPEKITIPVMVMCGLADKTLTPEQEMLPVWPKLNPPKAFLKFPKGGHYTFSDICQLDLETLAEEANFGDAEDAIEDGCGPENVPVEEAHPIIRQMGIGIFNYYLRDSPGSMEYFDAQAAEALGDKVIYDIEMQ